MVSGKGWVVVALGLEFARFKAEEVDMSVFYDSVQHPLSASNSA